MLINVDVEQCHATGIITGKCNISKPTLIHKKALYENGYGLLDFT